MRRSTLAAAFALAGCTAVLNIEDRTLEPKAGGSVTAGTLSCATYCDLVLTACTGARSSDPQDLRDLYASRDTCMATCEKLPLGTASDEKKNTIGCRYRQATLARDTGEPDDYCPAAGIGGDFECGSNCDGFCAVMIETCPTKDFFKSEAECLAECKKVPDHGDYSRTVPNENSVQCRLYHLTSATQDTTHCDHAFGQAKCCDHPPGTDVACVQE